MRSALSAGAAALLAFFTLLLAPLVLLDSAATKVAMAQSPCAAGPLVPSTGAYLGANTSAISTLEAQTGTHLRLDGAVSRWGDPQPSAALVADRAAGRLPALTIDPSGTSLARIAIGAEDAEIRRQAAGLRAFAAPLLLILDAEPEAASEASAAMFVAAWRHYVDVFRAEQVTNVAWVPILKAGTFAGGSADLWYPGDNYVDWIGATGYNGPSGARWTSFAEMFSAFASYGAAQGKPLLIAGVASGVDSQDPGRRAAWIMDAAQQVKRWPQIKALSWSATSAWEGLGTVADQQAFAAVAADTYFQAIPPTSVTGPAPTGTVSVLDVARAAQTAGFNGDDLITAVAVAGAESNFDRGAVGRYPPHTYYGLWQIQDSHADLLARYQPWTDPIQSARMAHAVWQASGWGGWQTYTDGSYSRYLPTAQQAATQLGGPADACGGAGSGAGQGVVAWALAHLGIPYLWGGCLAGVPSCGNPNISGRMDCSGYSSAAWWFGAHVALPRTAAEQWRATTPIPSGKEQPGDLIFTEFGVTGPGHVMIVVTPGNPGIAAEEPHTGDVSKEITYGRGGGTFGRPLR